MALFVIVFPEADFIKYKISTLWRQQNAATSAVAPLVVDAGTGLSKLHL